MTCRFSGRGDAFAGEVVFSGAETTHKDDDVGASDCDPGCLGEVLAVIANHGLEGDFDTEAIQLFGEVKRICVLEMRREQLRADGNDLGGHGESVNGRRSMVHGRR